MRFTWKTKYYWFLFVAGVTVSSLVADFVVPAGEGEQGAWWSHIDGFYALMGFIGCVAIVMIAKWLGTHWLQRKEDYYD